MADTVAEIQPRMRQKYTHVITQNGEEKKERQLKEVKRKVQKEKNGGKSTYFHY